MHNSSSKQKRGKRTYNALIKTGFHLLEVHELDDINVSDLTKEANSSVGAFYGHFKSKDQFFEAIIYRHLEIRSEKLDQMYDTLPLKKLIPALIKDIVNYYWKHRRFWRSVQMHNVRDTEFSIRFRDNFNNRVGKFISYIEHQYGRSLKSKEKEKINFAFQLLLGTVNNAAINESGPILLGENKFCKLMQSAFIQVSGIEGMEE